MQLKTMKQTGPMPEKKEKSSSNITRMNNRMKRRPYIKGVSGPAHLSFMDKSSGISDMKQHQLCRNDDQILTPNVWERDEYERIIEESEIKECISF